MQLHNGELFLKLVSLELFPVPYIDTKHSDLKVIASDKNISSEKYFVWYHLSCLT